MHRSITQLMIDQELPHAAPAQPRRSPGTGWLILEAPNTTFTKRAAPDPQQAIDNAEASATPQQAARKAAQGCSRAARHGCRTQAAISRKEEACGRRRRAVACLPSHVSISCLSQSRLHRPGQLAS